MYSLYSSSNYNDTAHGGYISTEAFKTAVRDAKRAGAAAWCFHTANSFRMNGSTGLANLLADLERAFLDDLPGVLASQPWGITPP